MALSLTVLVPSIALSEPVVTRCPQESMHRVFLLKAADGKTLASGMEESVTLADLVHSRLIFHFVDGSIDDETTVFTQGKVFRLLSDHHIQHGPSFPSPIDILIDRASGKVTWHEQRNGRDETRAQKMALPDDLGNGMMPLMVENFPRGAQKMRVSWIAIALRPLVVNLSIKADGMQDVDPAGIPERANEYTIHAELHGFVGFLAPLVNKQPADIHIWVTDQAAPSFVRLQGPFYQDASVWTVEPAAPEPAHSTAAH